jgi:hypothetical protein
MKKLLIPVIIIMLIVPVYLLLKDDTGMQHIETTVEKDENNKNQESIIVNNIDEFSVGYDDYKLEKGENLIFDYGTHNYYFYNKTRYQGTPYLYKNISISSTYLEVIEAFNIKEDFAALNVEIVDIEGSKIINMPYTDNLFINKDYKDVNIVFGYKLINGSWNMIPYNELSSYVGNLNSEDDVIIYMIDLVEDNGLLEKYHVAGVSVEYYG